MFQPYNIFIIAYFFSIGWCYSLEAEVWRRGSIGQNFSKENLLTGTEIFRASDNTQDIRLQTASYHSYRSIKSNLLYFDFETELPQSLHSRNSQFFVERAEYLPSPDTISGKRAALFNHNKHGVWITPRKTFFTAANNRHDFTIEMRLKPLFLRHKTILLEKIHLQDNKQSGIQISVQKRRLWVHFINLFRGLKDERFSVKFSSVTLIKLNVWQHLAVVYDSNQARVTLYLNGKEENVSFLKDERSTWQLDFFLFDNSPLVLAPLYVGLIDDFRIANYALSPEKDELHISPFEALSINFQTQQGTQREGYVYSALNSIPKQKTARFAQFSYTAQVPAGAVLYVYVRYSKEQFSPKNKELSWKRVDKRYLNLSVTRYFQWKAVFRSDPLGLRTPVLKGVQLNYTLVEPPSAPQNVRVIEKLTEGLRICLEWEGSLLNQPEKIQGYRIYYGLRPKEYFGYLTYYVMAHQVKYIGDAEQTFPIPPDEKQLGISQSKLTNSSLHNRLRFIIDNSLIEKNLSIDRKKKIPFLKTRTNYYFAITAYDDLSESEFSNEVYVVTDPE